METNPFLELISREDFNPDTYVNTLTVEGVDGLLEERQKINRLSDETKKALKKNVYANFDKFIRSARQISFLEGEMYSLGAKLTTQRNMMTEIVENAIVTEKVDVVQHLDEDDSRKNLAFLLEKVEGCSHVIETPGRHLIHDGDMVQLNPESFVPLNKVHMFLLNDSLMLASYQTNPNKRGGAIKYKYMALYELEGLAIVNVRDDNSIKNSIKILVFPDTHMYQLENAKAKRQWLEYIEEVKKKQAASNKVVRQAAAKRNQDLNPFAQESPSKVPVVSSSPKDLLNTEGMKEVPEDLDVLIAQRDFEAAVDQIEEVNAKLKDVEARAPLIREYRARIDHRVKQLTTILMSELSAPPERTLRTGSQSSRTAVTQLIRLGKSSEACQLFLKSRSTVIRYSMRQLKIEGATSLYIRKLSETFFETLCDACKEFYKSFPNKLYGVFSGFVVWAQGELENFVEIYRRQVFGSKSDVSVVADCVYVARQACSKLAETGFDLEYIFNSLIHEDVERCIKEHTHNFVDAVTQRAKEDTWNPHNFVSKPKLNKFLDSMINAGFDDIESHVYDSVYVSLTWTSISFCRSGISFLNDLLKLNQPSVQNLVDEGLRRVWAVQTEHIEASLNNTQLLLSSDLNAFIQKNATWLEDKVLAMSEARYHDSVGYASTELRHVHRTFGKIKSLAMFYQEPETV